MENKPQPLYRWPAGKFWLLVAPLLVITWVGLMFCHFRGIERMSSHDLCMAALILLAYFAVSAVARYALRKRAGL